MTITEGCLMLENLELIPVNIIDTTEKIDAVCEKYRIHSSQILFSKNKLQELLSEMDKSEFLHIVDSFRIHHILAFCDDTPILYGPYCTELLASSEISILLSNLKIRDIQPETLAKLRSRYTVKPQQNVQYHLNILFSSLTGDSTIHATRNLDLSPLSYAHEEETVSRDIAIKLVREHYATEQRLMKSISEGNYTAASEAWHFLHNAVSYKNIGHTLEVARVSAGITRTMLRIGALNAGLPAEINDRISGKSGRFMLKARTMDEIYMEHERLIKEYCDIIKEYKSKAYSSLVLSVRYLMENEYEKALTLEDIAEELSLSPSHIVHRFKRETGTTPMAYLNFVRMKKAAEALTKTSMSIQEIAAEVGILDSNYFVKCFKKVYGVTPSGYRKKYKG
ncbi:hypothetical protein BXO88_11435 [Oribacterium sp. C9]|uniref:helix-turn-helix transcriptional regulator n=1 Tax=Oribacterium sp. C9 TaxID=1943579 RepID=UPI0009902E1D|nr:AraC family transcriptional regulator [Oribacterium sp. C9]OON85691.1 hypothetical protein BXO88_11435 [Oribacterium sp. C9]